MKSIIKVSSLIFSIFILAGCGTFGTDSDSNRFEDDAGSATNLEEQSQVEPYSPQEDDVILKNDAMRNKELLDEFVEVSEKDYESEIRVVEYKENDVIIYNLKSRYDETADVGWIEVSPDLSHYEMQEDEVQDIFNNAPQQCASISADTTEGFYKLNECRTHWEYRLIPIVTATLTDEELNTPYERPEVVVGNDYYLVDPMTEIFLSESDAENWLDYYLDENEKKLEETVLDNVTKMLLNRVEVAITDNPVHVMSCEAGLCEVYSDTAYELKAFVVPEVKIDTHSIEEASEKDARISTIIDEESFWKETSERVLGIIDDTLELVKLYEDGDTFSSDKELADHLYNRINGNLNIIRYATLPDDEKIHKQYESTLMRTEFLFNGLYQAQVHVDQENKKELKVLVEDELIPLTNALKEHVNAIVE